MLKRCQLVSAAIASAAMIFPAIGNFAAAEVRNGVAEGITASSALPPGGTISFDPPCNFIQTLPLTGVQYLNPKTRVFFRGAGALLGECSNFSVSGYSAPNFLAWNCSSTLSDGKISSLPEFFQFTLAMSSVSINVGSAAFVGSAARLIAYNSSGAIIAQRSVALAAQMQTLTVTGFRNIASARLFGPCSMVADDLLVTL